MTKRGAKTRWLSWTCGGWKTQRLRPCTAGPWSSSTSLPRASEEEALFTSVLRKAGRRLHKFNTRKASDHMPLIMCADWHLQHRTVLQSAARLSRDALVNCLKFGHQRETLQERIRQLGEAQPDTKSLLPDAMWERLQISMQKIGVGVLPTPAADASTIRRRRNFDFCHIANIVLSNLSGHSRYGTGEVSLSIWSHDACVSNHRKLINRLDVKMAKRTTACGSNT